MKREVMALFAAGAMLGFSMPAPAQELPQAADPGLSQLREIRSTYIIEFDPTVESEDIPARSRALAARFNGSIRHIYGAAYRGFSMRMSDAAVARLLDATDTGIVRVTRDELVSIDRPPAWAGGGGGGGGGGSCSQEIGWNIKRVVSVLNTTKACPGTGDGDRAAVVYDASAVQPGGSLGKVCVLDTGIDFSHPDLNVNVGASVNFASGRDASDKNGHGTHVAGIIAAKDNGFGVVGVAPGAELIAIKVLGNGGTGAYSDVIAGVEETLAIGCDVANMSLGGPPYAPLDDAVTCAAGDPSRAYCQNNTVRFALAAGNESEDADGHSPARANAGAVYTIAAFTSTGSFASYSNYGKPPVDYALPGSSITSTVTGGSYATYNGTSMAAPHMAGLLLWQIAGVPYATSGNIAGPFGVPYPVPAR